MIDRYELVRFIFGCIFLFLNDFEECEMESVRKVERVWKTSRKLCESIVAGIGVPGVRTTFYIDR